MESELPQLRIALSIPVFVVACHREPGMCGVNADLMRLARAQVDLHQRRQPAEELQWPERADRHLAVTTDRNVAFASHAFVGRKRELDALVAELPVTTNER